MKLQADLSRQRGGPLAAMEAALGDTQPLLRSLARDLRAGFSRQFATGQGWAPDLLATVRRKASPTLLVDRGTLRASLTSEGAPYAVTQYGTDSVLVATRAPSAGPLQRGARGAPARNPARFDSRRFAEAAQTSVAVHLIGGGRGLRRLGL